MALGRIWPAHFQRIFGGCRSRALPICFLKAPRVFPFLWTATLLLLRTAPRTSCSVVFAAPAIPDSRQVNHGLLRGGSKNAEGPLVDAGIADTNGAFFGSVASATHGGGTRPQVGNLRRVLYQLHDTSDAGTSDSEHSVDALGEAPGAVDTGSKPESERPVDARDEVGSDVDTGGKADSEQSVYAGDEGGIDLDTGGKPDSEHSVDAHNEFGSALETGNIGSTEGDVYGGESRKYSDEDISRHSARLSELGQEGFSLSQHPGMDESLMAVDPAGNRGDAHNPPAHEHADYGQPMLGGELSAEEEEVRASDGTARDWPRPDTGGGAAGRDEGRWGPDKRRDRKTGERSDVPLSVHAGKITSPGTEGDRKLSRRTWVKTGPRTRKRRCVLAGTAKAIAMLVAAFGVALLGGRALASRRRKAVAAPVPKA